MSLQQFRRMRCNFKEFRSAFFFFFFLEFRKRASGHKEKFCYYCEKYHFKLPRHLRRRHKNEDLVKEALAFPKKSREQHNKFKEIASMGEYKSNIANLLKKSGKISIKRNTQLDKTVVENYVPCVHCGSFYYFKTLYKHQKNCFMKSKSTNVDKANDARVTIYALKSSRALLDGALSDGKFEEVHRLVLSGMNRDEIYIVITNDQLLLLFGAAQLNHTEIDRYGDIRYSLRSLARLLKFREISEVGCESIRTCHV